MHNCRLRVAWDNSLARRNPTGTGVYAKNLIRELHSKPEIDLEVFNGWDPAKRKTGDFGNQSILSRAGRAARGLTWSHAYFPYLLWRGKFDLLHSPAFIVPLHCSCPTIATIHDVSFRIFPEHFEARWRKYMEYMMPRILESVTAVICVSEHAKQELLKFYKVSAEKVHVIHNGVDHCRFNPKARLDKQWARKTGISKDYILHVGLLSQRKNLPMLLRAIGSLRTRGKLRDIQFVLAGPELSVLTGAQEIYDSIRESGLSDMLVLTGFVPDDKMAGLYAEARLLVMPSIYEGFGLPVAEAMACGTPAIASNTSSLPEISGDAAILAPPQDEAAWAEAILSVLENNETAARLRQLGLVQSQKFNWRNAATETLAVYHSVAETKQ